MPPSPPSQGRMLWFRHKATSMSPPNQMFATQVRRFDRFEEILTTHSLAGYPRYRTPIGFQRRARTRALESPYFARYRQLNQSQFAPTVQKAATFYTEPLATCQRKTG